MAFCSKCGAELAEGAQFCASCGTPAGGAANDGSKRVQKFVSSTIRKCPSCGAEVPNLTASCPTCGFEFNGDEVSSVLIKFQNKLEEAYYGSLKADIVKEFQIPNNSEVLTEFALMAKNQIAHINFESDYETARDLLNAWSYKLDEAEGKANIVLKNNPSRLQQISEIANSARETLKKKNKESVKTRRARKRKPIIIGILIVMVIFGPVPVVIISMSKSSSKSVEKENHRLEIIYQEAIDAIKSGDTLSAQLKLSDIVWTVDTDYWDGNEAGEENAAIWDKKKAELQKLIDEQKKKKK